MAVLFATLGILIVLVAIILLVVDLVRKKSKKKSLITLGAGFVVFIFGFGLIDVSEIPEVVESDPGKKVEVTAEATEEDEVKAAEEDEKLEVELKEEKEKAELREKLLEDAKNRDEEQEAAPVPAEPKNEEASTNQDADIKKVVESIINDDLNKVSINQLLVNENIAKDDGSYIVLPHLMWDVKNGAKTTRGMLEKYSDHLAAKLADESSVGEITIFWEVPYHLEGNNVAKYMYERSGDGMAKVDQWLAPIIQ